MIAEKFGYSKRNLDVYPEWDFVDSIDALAE